MSITNVCLSTPKYSLIFCISLLIRICGNTLSALGNGLVCAVLSIDN